MTLWQMFKEWWSPPPIVPPVVVKYQMNLQLGSSVQIDTIDLRGKTYFVKEINVISRAICDNDFTDFLLMHRSLKEGDKTYLRLRFVPVEDAEKGIDKENNILVLELYDEFGYNEDFNEVLKEEELVFDSDEGAKYWRINDVKNCYEANNIEYWDYWRETPDEAGENYKEFVFVEKNLSNGWFQIWRGTEVESHRISVI